AVLAAERDAGVDDGQASDARAIPGKGIAARIDDCPEEAWIGNRRLLTERTDEPPEHLLGVADNLEQAGKTVMFVGRGSTNMTVLPACSSLSPAPSRCMAGRTGWNKRARPAT